MKNEVLAQRLRFFKETEEDQEELSEIDARSVARGRAEGIPVGEVKGKTEMATKLIELGEMSLERIAEISGLPIEELRKIQRSFNPV